MKAEIADAKLQIASQKRDTPRFEIIRTLRAKQWAVKKKPLTEKLIKRLHALLEKGPKAEANDLKSSG